MSQAFVKETDEQWLHDIQPTMNALIAYLTRENNGIRVYQKNTSLENGNTLYEMSNGSKYAKDENAKWYIVW